MKNKAKKGRAIVRYISVDTILKAKACDKSAMQDILDYYKGYILKLCKFELYDASGNVYTCYDEDLYHELQLKLITAIRDKFELK